MSWKVSDLVSERVKLIGLTSGGQWTVAGLCREFGISRMTAYKCTAGALKPKDLKDSKPIFSRGRCLWILPYPSTIGDILKKEGLVHCRRRRSWRPLSSNGPSVVTAPNQEWKADFKGEFRLGNGEYCFPLTVTDAFSR